MLYSLKQNYLQKIQNKEIYGHYLKKKILKKLVNIMGQAVLQFLRIKTVKYFVVIVNWTLNIRYKEQMSIVIRYVTDGV